jgi:hypothetical protein
MNESTIDQSSLVAPQTFGEGNRDFAAPLGTVKHGRLEIVHGLAKAVIRADAALPDLVRAHFEGPEPEAGVRDGVVTIRYPRFAPGDWIKTALMMNRHTADVTLNATLPWEILFDGGISNVRADLGMLQVTRLTIEGGASDVEVTLAAAHGIIPLRIDGGVSRFTVHRPAGVPVRLRIRGSASHLVLDDQRFGAIAGEVQLNSRHDPTSPDRYEIEIGGGASKLTID